MKFQILKIFYRTNKIQNREGNICKLINFDDGRGIINYLKIYNDTFRKNISTHNVFLTQTLQNVANRIRNYTTKEDEPLSELKQFDKFSIHVHD